MRSPLLRLLRERGVVARMAQATALQSLTVLSGTALMGTSAWLLATAALHPSIAALHVAIVGVRFFGICRALLRYLERVVSHDVALALMNRIRARVFRALIPLAPARLRDSRSGDVLTRLLDDVTSLEGLYVRMVGPIAASVLVVTVVVAALAARSPSLAACLAAGMVATAGVPALLVRRWTRRSGAAAQARGDLAAHVVDTVQGLGEVLALGREQAHVATAAAIDDRVLRHQTHLARASAAGGALTTLGADLTTVVVLAFAVLAARQNEISGVQVAVVALVALAAFESVAALPAATQALAPTRAAARRLFEVLDDVPAVSEPATPAAIPSFAAGAPVLEARQLSFTYPDETIPALHDLSLVLERGRRVAVVGPSGSGKTTLLHLILRFWDVPHATLFLGGHDVRAWQSDTVRDHVSFADQRAQLLTGTLRENLVLAPEGPSEDALAGMLDAVGLGELVASMPGGLDTWIGEQGQQLSGGERQRLAVARALLRPAALVLLDEPTAHLDGESEKRVLSAIAEASPDRATLVVTHRLSGLEAFDEIIVLERGRVVERGTAASLAQATGTFARLLAIQRSQAALSDDVFARSRS